MTFLFLLAVCTFAYCNAFMGSHSRARRALRSSQHGGSLSLGLQMTGSEPVSDSMAARSALRQLGGRGVGVAAAVLGSSALTLLGQPSPALASKLSDVNSKLDAYGAPPMLYLPKGFSPLVSEYGRGVGGSAKTADKVQNPIVVNFAHPSGWVEARTSVNNNGEAGTISANDYVKGDSAFLFTTLLDADGSVSVNNKKALEEIVFKSVTQKGDVTESFAIKNVRSGGTDTKGNTYVLVDVIYRLNTEAGFLITRQGFASVTAVGGTDKKSGKRFAQCLTAVTTDRRYKKLSADLEEVVKSFRVNKLDSGVFARQKYEGED